MGAPLTSFGAGKIGLAAEIFEYYAGWIDKYGGECYPAEDGFFKFVRHEPLGVCAGIIPWNSPLASVALKAAPALAMGKLIDS
jgi:aldehyde dehydrogenase (NAD+)